MDTIYALASASGKAGVSVVRVSGPKTPEVMLSISGTMPEGGRAVRVLRDQNGDAIDQALVLHFPEGKSFTGEQTVEFHVHGSVSVCQRLLEVLSRFSGVRHAEAGEFTHRAFENGKLDLSQVEGLADLIDAETESQRKQALRVFAGDLSKKADAWRSELVRVSALFTASIDFADEDIPDSVIDQAQKNISDLVEKLEQEISFGKNAERIRSGFEVAIVGAPNAGKSTLLNRLAGREAAITSDVAGTTRDVIEVRMDIQGIPVTLLDTAGLRLSDDTIERIGIERAIERAKNADLRLFLYEKSKKFIIEPESEDIVLQSKNDVYRSDTPSISALTGDGVDYLLSEIFNRLNGRVLNAGLAIRERHRIAIEGAVKELQSANYMLLMGDDIEIVAEHIQSAIRSMDCIVGKVDVETVLGDIFSSFCIGK